MMWLVARVCWVDVRLGRRPRPYPKIWMRVRTTPGADQRALAAQLSSLGGAPKKSPAVDHERRARDEIGAREVHDGVRDVLRRPDADDVAAAVAALG
jgi:hypothetical protein